MLCIGHQDEFELSVHSFFSLFCPLGGKSWWFGLANAYSHMCPYNIRHLLPVKMSAFLRRQREVGKCFFLLSYTCILISARALLHSSSVFIRDGQELGKCDSVDGLLVFRIMDWHELLRHQLNRFSLWDSWPKRAISQYASDTKLIGISSCLCLTWSPSLWGLDL